jgi:hypothetical protein
MKFNRIAIPAFALLLGVTGLGSAKAYAAPQGPPPPGFGHEHGWDTPPGEWNDIQRRGFHDGMEGARKDMQNHRRPDVNNRDEYRHPNLPHELRGAYRDAFRRGYDRYMSHMMGGHGPRY